MSEQEHTMAKTAYLSSQDKINWLSEVTKLVLNAMNGQIEGGVDPFVAQARTLVTDNRSYNLNNERFLLSAIADYSEKVGHLNYEVMSAAFDRWSSMGGKEISATVLLLTTYREALVAWLKE